MGKPGRPRTRVPPPDPCKLDIDPDWLDWFKLECPRKREFLLRFEACGSAKTACRLTKIRPSELDKWLNDKDESGQLTRDAETMRMAMDMALEHRVQVLENEARRRAFMGSDLLLIFLLKAARPNVYQDNMRLVHAGTDPLTGQPRNQLNIQVNNMAPAPLAIHEPEQLERVMELARRYNLVDRLFPKVKDGEVAADPVGAEPVDGSDAEVDEVHPDNTAPEATSFAVSG